jgi:hypothetical protein
VDKRKLKTIALDVARRHRMVKSVKYADIEQSLNILIKRFENVRKIITNNKLKLGHFENIIKTINAQAKIVDNIISNPEIDPRVVTEHYADRESGPEFDIVDQFELRLEDDLFIIRHNINEINWQYKEWKSNEYRYTIDGNDARRLKEFMTKIFFDTNGNSRIDENIALLKGLKKTI